MCISMIVVSNTYSGYFFFQAEDGIRDLVRSRGLGDVYKRQVVGRVVVRFHEDKIVDDLWSGTNISHDFVVPGIRLSLIHI